MRPGVKISHEHRGYKGACPYYRIDALFESEERALPASRWFRRRRSLGRETAVSFRLQVLCGEKAPLQSRAGGLI